MAGYDRDRVEAERDRSRALGRGRLRQESAGEAGGGYEGRRRAHRAALADRARNLDATRSGPRALPHWRQRQGRRRRRGRIHIRCPERRPLADQLHRLCASAGAGGNDAGSPHSWRSIFRDWCATVAHVDGDIAELCLAHSLGPVKEAYFRDKAVERRRGVMTDYGRWLAGVAEGTVIAFPARA